MARPKRRRNAIAMAVSIALHAVVLTALALHAPKLFVPREEAGPPEPIIPILIMPRTPPAPPGSKQPPQPIRLHRRRLPHEAAAPPAETPFVTPKEIPTPREPPPPRGPVQPRITVQPSPGAQLSTALRGGLVGCANPQLLTPAERERCLQRFGRGASEAPFIAPPIAAGKQAAFDRAAQAKARPREGGLPTGIASPSSDSGASYRANPDEPPPPPPLRP